MNQKLYKILSIVLLVAIMVLSFTAIAGKMNNPNTYSNTYKVLDENRKTVLRMTAGAASASTLLTLIPDDVATPIADKVADVSGYCVLILGAILAEKYCIGIIALLVFRILIPLCCILGIIFILCRKKRLLSVIIRVFVFSVALTAAIPLSVYVSKLVSDTNAESREQAIESVENATGEIESASDVTDKVENLLGTFVEASAIMIISSCVIPVLTLFFMYILLKMLLGQWLSTLGSPAVVRGDGSD